MDTQARWRQLARPEAPGDKVPGSWPEPSAIGDINWFRRATSIPHLPTSLVPG